MRFIAMRLFFRHLRRFAVNGSFLHNDKGKFTEYSSNVTLLCTNYRNKYILTVANKNYQCFFYIELEHVKQYGVQER